MRRLICEFKDISQHSLSKVEVGVMTNLFTLYANNNDTDQPANLRRLISALVIRYLGSIPTTLVSKVAFYLARTCRLAGRFEFYLVAQIYRQVFS